MGWIYPCIGEFQSMVDISSTERSERSVSCFEETKIIVKIPAIYWSYKTASHAAELTVGGSPLFSKF